MEHNFGEKQVESIKGVDCPVWQTPKYEISKAKAIEIIDSKKYDLTDGDFWVLMNTYSNGTKVMYTGLIITHNGCLKINDKLENGFKAEFLKREWLEGSLIYEYNDGEMYEVGEVNKDNCKNPYPYAMAFKRCFDRVVLKKSKLAFSGIYSEVEADEFTEKLEEKKEEKPKKKQKKSEIFDQPIYENMSLKELADLFRSRFKEDAQGKILANYKYDKAEDLGIKVLIQYLRFADEKAQANPS